MKKVARDGMERNKYSIEGVELTVSNKRMFEYMCNVIGLPVENCSHISRPVYPIFEFIYDHCLKALLATGIGTDYYIDGVPGVTPKVVYDLTKALRLNHTPVEEYTQKYMQMFINYWKAFKKITR